MREGEVAGKKEEEHEEKGKKKEGKKGGVWEEVSLLGVFDLPAVILGGFLHLLSPYATLMVQGTLPLVPCKPQLISSALSASTIAHTRCFLRRVQSHLHLPKDPRVSSRPKPLSASRAQVLLCCCCFCLVGFVTVFIQDLTQSRLVSKL